MHMDKSMFIDFTVGNWTNPIPTILFFHEPCQGALYQSHGRNCLSPFAHGGCIQGANWDHFADSASLVVRSEAHGLGYLTALM